MDDYPASIVPVNHVAPVPRRVRAYLGAEKVLDTTRALYVWEWPHYPQYYIPLDDVRRDVFVSEGHTQRTGRGLAELHGLEAGQAHRPRAARVITDSAIEGLKGTIRFEWAALDAWFDEVSKASWKSTADVKRRYATASIVSAERIVFNVKGNDYRLVVAVDFEKGIVWIKWIGTHKAYDKIDVTEMRHGN